MAGIRPEDILDDNTNYIELNAIHARKGSVAAFLKNIEVVEDPHTSREDKAASLEVMKELAPVLAALNLHKHVVFQNKDAQKIIMEAASKL